MHFLLYCSLSRVTAKMMKSYAFEEVICDSKTGYNQEMHLRIQFLMRSRKFAIQILVKIKNANSSFMNHFKMTRTQLIFVLFFSEVFYFMYDLKNGGRTSILALFFSILLFFTSLHCTNRSW